MIGTHKTAIPCRRPRVATSQDNPDSDLWGAVCQVPGCDWSYGPGGQTDVEDTATGHRRWHRAAVPESNVRIHAGGGYTVVCACGFVRQDGTTTTRTEAQNVETYHLGHDHGLVTCS